MAASDPKATSELNRKTTMISFSRRQFLGSSAAVVSAAAIAGDASATVQDATGPADLIIKGANLLTMDSDNLSASAIAIRGQHILAVGSDSDVLNLQSANTEIVDGRGYTVTPGFIDAHSQSKSMRCSGRSATVREKLTCLPKPPTLNRYSPGPSSTSS